MVRSSGTSATSFAASEAGDDDVEDADEAIDDSHEDGADAIDDCC